MVESLPKLVFGDVLASPQYEAVTAIIINAYAQSDRCTKQEQKSLEPGF